MIEIREHCLAWNNKELCVLIISVSKLGVFTSFIIIIPHIIKNQFYWLKDNHMTSNNLDIFASNCRQR
jgi:hypothetical protein